MTEAGDPKINPETVAALLENARELAHDEEARGDSLKTRAAWLLGFQGVILTIVLTQVGSLSSGTHLGPVLRPVVASVGLVAVALLLDAARYALKTLSIVQLWHVGPSEVKKYPTWEFIVKEPTEAQGEMLRGWVRQFEEEREANNIKAGQLENSFGRLIWSFSVLAALVAIVALRAFGV